MLRRWLFVMMFLLVTPAFPCSICRCGDPLFSALGPSVFSTRQWRVGLDEDRFEKENAVRDDAGVVAGNESEVEYRTTLSASYSWNDAFTVFVRVPWSSKRIVSVETASGTQESSSASGLADPELLFHARLWAAPMTGLGRRTWIAVQLGVKTAWGENEVRENGERVEQHLQPGTGATDAIGGLSAVHILGLDDTVFASTQYRRTGTNAQGYRYGDAWFVNAGLEHRFDAHLDGVLELNYRHADRDVMDATGALDPDTGGAVLYAQPRLIVSVGGGVVLRAAALVPIAHALDGVQSEHTVYNAGVTIVF